MKEDLESAQRYRQRAEELRAIAQATVDPNARKALLQVAEDYERLAETRERIAERERGGSGT
jgi:hypothetical protein